MNTADFAVLAIVAALVAGALYAMHRSRKNGKHCIGCPDSGCCSGSCRGASGASNRPER